MANFVAVRTRYYKHQKGQGVLDHAHAERNGFTRSANVHQQFSENNAGWYYHGAESSMDAYHKVYQRHAELKGKKPRSDMNTLFEHVVILSEEQFAELEEITKEAEEGADLSALIISRLKMYADKIKEEFGFEPLGIDFHLDEGTKQDDGSIKRNVHAHVMFYNYDFKREKAPLKNLMVKGKNENGKSNDLNPNFARMQDIAAESFEALGFERGVSKGLDNRKHEKKAQWIRSEQKRLEQGLRSSELKLNQGNIAVKQTKDKHARLSQEVKQRQAQLQDANEKLQRLEQEAGDVAVRIKRMQKQEEYVKTIADEAIGAILKPLADKLSKMASNVSEKALRELQERIRAYDESKSDGVIPESLQRELDDSLRPFRP